MTDNDNSEHEIEVNCNGCGKTIVEYTDLYNRPEKEIREVATCNDCKHEEAAKDAYEQELGAVPMGQQARVEQERQ